MCYDPPSSADGRAYTDSSWRIGHFGIEKIDEEDATIRSTSIAEYWA